MMRCRFLRRGRTAFSILIFFAFLTIINLCAPASPVRHKQQDYDTYIGMAIWLLHWISGSEHRVFGAFYRPIQGNYEPAPYKYTTGDGENGRAVKSAPWESETIEQSLKEYSVNQCASDKIRLNRTIPDLRKHQCKYWHYPPQLPSVTVIIAFYNEGWSTLLRTVKSVINRTPSTILKEILLVDDASTAERLNQKLSLEITKPEYRHLVKLLRNHRREGVIESRVLGSKMATGQAIVFLDSHCEVGINWLPPLLAVIKASRTTVAVPILDVIDSMNFTLYPQSKGALARGLFDWDLGYRRVGGLPTSDALSRRYETEPYRSPVLAGGVFAIDKTYFLELGSFDPGLYMFGGENYELSFKVWMCGGSLVWVPCSRVAHAYRVNGRPPYSFSEGSLQLIQDKNLARVAEVWMDDYKQYFYATKSYLYSPAIKLGDLKKQKEFRANNNCKTFRWFLETVATDLLKKFPLPSLPLQSGEIRTFYGNGICMDTRGIRPETIGGRVGLYKCHGQGGNQLFHLTTKNDIRVNEDCLCARRIFVNLCPCDSDDVIRHWEIDKTQNTVKHKQHDLCLAKKGVDVILEICAVGKKDQMWKFIEYTREKD